MANTETTNLRALRSELADTNVLPPDPPSRTAPHPDACLVLIHPVGPSLGRRYPVGDAPMTIGREPACEIEVDDGSVSRRHAKIAAGPDGAFFVEDLGSTNGTYVNDARVRTAALKDGDYLRVGPCLYRFLSGGNVEAEYHEEIHKLAVMDPLTGVHNRRSLVESLAREVDRARRFARGLAVVLFDIDHFKAVNDKLGHLAGDMVLKEVVARIRTQTRRDELLARYGGEEFAALLPEADAEGAVTYAERARKAVCAAPIVFDRESCPVTVSAGVGVLVPGSPLDADDLLRQADDRLYEAKRAGRNRVAPSVRITAGSGAIHRPAVRV
jgi:two-component system cell cycle response regulator